MNSIENSSWGDVGVRSRKKILNVVGAISEEKRQGRIGAEEQTYTGAAQRDEISFDKDAAIESSRFKSGEEVEGWV
ncbi:hypothetical protein D8B26_002730 [Coccidioides posadasii str. Silveira]|uniref:uncharacterized protein n=1 Tax=Coccidioides posadasii (strain RMSCC 757 / Silveira) TaxID=443226 RepID=UPI001BF1066B|nr:hypothetical protein D8B26_002730 [Coccidioides posadasii str. Silveira]